MPPTSHLKRIPGLQARFHHASPPWLRAHRASGPSHGISILPEWRRQVYAVARPAPEPVQVSAEATQNPLDVIQATAHVAPTSLTPGADRWAAFVVATAGVVSAAGVLVFYLHMLS